MSMQPVILITPGFTADETDRNCLPTLQLYAESLHSGGRAVMIIALDYPFSSVPYTWKGIPVYPCGGRNARWLKPRTVMRALTIGHRLLDEYPDAVLHSFWLNWPCAIGERLARRRDVRHITTLMGQDALPSNKKWFRYLRPERQGEFVVLSRFHQQKLQETSGIEVMHIIPWGAGDAEIPENISNERSIDVIGAGSLIPLKNWDLWLKTIAIIKKSTPELQVQILGSGPLLARLQKTVRRLDLEQNVIFRGELPRPQVLEAMQQSKVLLHTSDFESQGYVLTEAAMCGCHLVSTPVGIAPQVCACAQEPDALAPLVLSALKQHRQKQQIPLKMTDTLAAYSRIYADR